jgi:ADP-ribosylglycohydrolase
MLGLAAGDTAGGLWELGYSATTQQATVVAYQLIESGRLEPDALERSIRELDGADGEEPVYRSESPAFRSWLDHPGTRPPDTPVPVESASRAVPLGVTFRRDPDELCREAIELGRVFGDDPQSIVAGVIASASVAASCFGQSGRDLVAGVAETVSVAAGLAAAGGSGRTWPDVGPELEALVPMVGAVEGDEAVQMVAGSAHPTSWDLVKIGLLLAAAPAGRPHLPIENAARIGGSHLGGMVGGIVGARVGIRAWPWAFANDTWFAEMGRRLVRGPNQIDDLPIPYAVEHHLNQGERQGLY